MTSTATQSLRARFVSGVGWSVGGAGFSRLVTFAATAIAARWLGVAEFGRFGMIQSTIGLFGVLAGAGLGLSVTKHVAQFRTTHPSKALRCIALSIRFAYVSGGLTSIGMILAGDWIARTLLKSPELTSVLRVSSGLVAFGAVTGVQLAAVTGFENARALAGLSGARAVFGAVGLLLGARHLALFGAVTGLVIGEGLSLVCNAIVLRALTFVPVRLSAQLERTDIALMWRFSIIALLASLAVMPAMWFANLVLVSEPDGYTAMGIFNAADKWRQSILFIPASTSTIILSMLSQLSGSRDTKGFRKLFKASLLANVGTSTLAVLALVALSPIAMGTVYGPDFRVGTPTLAILSLSVISIVTNNVLGQVLVSHGRIGIRFVFDAVLSVTLAGSAWLLVPIYREEGLAIASLISYSVVGLGLVIPVRRIMAAA